MTAAEYRLLITGSRSWPDRVAIAGEIGAAAGVALARGLRLVVVHGACPPRRGRGADWIADVICRMQGIAREPHPARWDDYPKGKAGFVRNAQMVNLGADRCAAFALPCREQRCEEKPLHPTHGTCHCAETAERGGIPVTRIGAGWAA